jgi:hypothetical protein
MSPALHLVAVVAALVAVALAALPGATAGGVSRLVSPEDGHPLQVVQTLRHRVRAGMSKTMFATSNQINSTTVTVEVLPADLHLWEGAWAPSPLDPPMDGLIRSIASGACYRSGCHGFTAKLTAPLPAGRVNGSFILETASGSGVPGYVGIAFAQVGRRRVYSRAL